MEQLSARSERLDRDETAQPWHGWWRDRQVTTEEVAALVVELATRAERWLSRHRFGADDGEEEHGDDDALLLMQAASVQGRSAVSGGRRARRFQVHRGRAYALPPRCAGWGGY
ncbi:MAG: hypothetical protein ACJATT_005267, partial [Myxococcota bacterium]